MNVILVIIYLIFTTSGLILIKLGGNSGSVQLINSNLNFSINWISMIGMFLYIISFLLFTKIVTLFNLSYIFPICMGIVQILTLVAAFLIFKERFTPWMILGVSLVIIGIILMNFKR